MGKSREAGIEIGDIVVPAEGWPPMAVVRIHVEVGEAQCIWRERTDRRWAASRSGN